MIARHTPFSSAVATNKGVLCHPHLRDAERKLVERAKGILMQQKRVGEDEAFRMMRKLAMDRNRRLADIAQQVIDIAELGG